MPRLPSRIKEGFDWDQFFSHAEVRDVLDSVSVAFAYANDNLWLPFDDYPFVDEVATILAEESVAYTVDEDGIIKPKFDPGFQAAREEAVSGINATGNNAAEQFLNQADEFLLSEPMNGLGAIWSVFQAVECLFKVAFPGETHLQKAAIKKRMASRIDSRDDLSNEEKGALRKELAVFEQWVDAVHFFRHAPSSDQVNPPRETTVMLLVSQGWSLLRWFAADYSAHGDTSKAS